MKDLVEGGVFSKIKYGVKLLARGADKFTDLKTPITLEVSDASLDAIAAVKETGGNIKVQYRTPLLMRYHIKPYNFKDYKSLKTPMPPPKKVKKLEQLRSKGLEVDYPRAPWYTDNVDDLEKEKEDRAKRIAEASNAEFLEQYPAKREHRSGKPRIERGDLPWHFKFPS